MGAWWAEAATTVGRSDRELERLVLDLGAEAAVTALGQHWGSVLRRLDGREVARPLRVGWRLTLPNGFYAVEVSTEPGCDGGTSFPGPAPVPADVTYQWYVLGLLRVMSGEHDMAYAFRRRWVAVSGDTAIWRALHVVPSFGVSLEARLHRWDDA